MNESKKEVMEERSKKEKYESYLNKFYKILIYISIICLFFITPKISDFRSKLIKLNPSYNFPKISHLLISIIFLFPFLLYCQSLFCNLFKRTIVEKSLALKYVNAKDEEMEMKAKIYRNKLAMHLFKSSFYSIVCVYGYIVLKDYDFFPKSLLGKGEMKNMFNKGYPETFYFKRNFGFDLYYLINLNYYLCDFVWLLTSEKPNDYINMLLHHICTIALILFSYLANYTQVGAIVLLLHMTSDVFVHSTRFLLQTRFPSIFAEISGVILTINYVYMRLYVLGEVIYTIYRYINWDWGFIVTTLWLFLIFLFTMHINWSYLLLSKAYELLFKAKLFEDTVDFNKTVNNELNKLKQK